MLLRACARLAARRGGTRRGCCPRASSTLATPATWPPSCRSVRPCACLCACACTCALACVRCHLLVSGARASVPSLRGQRLWPIWVGPPAAGKHAQTAIAAPMAAAFILRVLTDPVRLSIARSPELAAIACTSMREPIHTLGRQLKLSAPTHIAQVLLHNGPFVADLRSPQLTTRLRPRLPPRGVWAALLATWERLRAASSA